MGRIEVICGPMFSGKTQNLIRHLRGAQLRRARALAVKPDLDRRFPSERIVTHDGAEWPAISVSSADEVAELSADLDVVGIDEAQFFNSSLLDAVMRLRSLGVRVIVAGLDYDFRGSPFEPVPQILDAADHVLRLTARCAICGGKAGFTQRVIGGAPAPATTQTVLIGASELYEPRCIRCFIPYERPSPS